MDESFNKLSDKYNEKKDSEMIGKIRNEIEDMVGDYVDIINKVGNNLNESKNNNNNVITPDDIVYWIIDRINNEDLNYNCPINTENKLLNVLKHERLLIDINESGNDLNAKINYPKIKKYINNYRGNIPIQKISDLLKKIDCLIYREIEFLMRGRKNLNVEELANTFKIKKYEAKKIIEKILNDEIALNHESELEMSTKNIESCNEAYKAYLKNLNEWEKNSPLYKINISANMFESRLL